MKQNLLRRLSALVLAFVMAASLCVTPAWAASAPGSNTPKLDRNIIVLPENISTSKLTISNVIEGDTIKWTATGGISVSDNETVVKENETESSVTLTFPAGQIKGTITVTATHSGDSAAYTEQLYCYVYKGTAPITARDPLPILEIGKTHTYYLEVTIEEHGEFYTDFRPGGDLWFATNSSGYVQIGNISVKTSEGDKKILSVPLTGLKKGTISIEMHTKDGYTRPWDLTIKDSSDVYLTFITLERDNLEMTVGDTYDRLKLGSLFSPTNANMRKLTWSLSPTSSSNVVEVDEDTGVVKAIGPGKATIVATAEGGLATATCSVTVKEASSNLTLDPTSKTLYTYGAGQTGETPKAVRLTATPGGENSQRVEYKWAIRDQSVATLSGGAGRNATVTAAKAGSTIVTVTADFYDLPATNPNRERTATRTATCTITVLDRDSVAVTGVTLDRTKHTMPVDDTITLSVASVTPSNAPVKSVTWSSTAPGVASVDPNTGTVTALKAGEAAIIAKPEFGITQGGVCIVTVTPKAESINLRATNTTFDSNTPGTNHYFYTFQKVGDDDLKVRAVFTPSAANDPVRWTSKDPSVAKASTGTTINGSVSAVAPGVTTITAVPLDHNGKERVLSAGPAEIEVTVSGLAIQRTVDGVTSTITSLTLAEGRRQLVNARVFGSADNGSASCQWSSSDPSIVAVSPGTGVSTTLTARRPGTVTLTAIKGSYTAYCTVTVGEDAAVVINASTPPGSPLQFSTLASQLQNACTSKTGASLSYVTNLSVASTDQGILHDQHHSSADTGAGVGAQDMYYPGTAPKGQRSLNDLSFVPRTTFSGTAEITYAGRSTNNQTFTGTIRVTVNGTGDVMYSSNEGSVVHFLADDFNLYHPNLRSVSFTPPQENRGTLYYNYTSASQPGTKVTASDSYNRTGTPSLDRVAFVPASGYTGTVTISYRGTETSGRSFTGTVTINVNGGGAPGAPGDIYYSVPDDSWVTFRPSDFSNASRYVLGETLSYVRFAPPPSSEGTLFYNYRGFGNYDGTVADTTSYYYSGTPSLSGVTFVPTTTTPDQVDIQYTGYTTRGNTFTGTIHIGKGQAPQQDGGLRYTVTTGKSVSLNAYDLNTACVAATGASLNYVLFSPLPAVGQGTLRYSRNNSSSYNSIATSTRCYREPVNTWDVGLNNVSFLANNSYTGTVTIPFTGYNTNNTSFTGEVVIQVTPPTSGDSVYSGTTASPLRLSSSRMRSACADVLDGTLSYITFNSLPNASAGRLYLGYTNFNNSGTLVNTGTRYCVSGNPGIDQISFVPKGRFNGQVSVPYTATNTSGKSVTGLITFNITSTGSSNYFNDLGGHTWAAPAVDYLYQNGVTNGITPNTYGPNQRILRRDFVLMLCRAFRLSGGSGYSFADVPTNAYYADAVATAKQLGVVNGDGRNFRPNDQVTRQDAMVMIKNALDAAGRNPGTASTSILGRFPDGTSVSSYARDAVSTLVQMGAVNGDNGMLYPQNSITRAEAAMILHFVMTM